MAEDTTIDREEVDKIIETMKRKYREEGMEFEEVSGGLKELRGIIAEDTYTKQDIQTREDLESFDSKTTQNLGNIYLQMKSILHPLQESLKKFPLSQEIGYYLYSANMPYSANQYIAISSAAGLVAALVALVASLFIGTIIAAMSKNLTYLILLPIIMTILGGIVTTSIMLYIPRQKATSRGNACSAELPFALRHMATELRAGIGLFKTIQAVTSADYGVLSEEFARTITEIEEGTDTGAALKHLALRTQSKPLRSAINHMLRAMRVGGNLSNIMSEIAEDVSEDLKNRISSFSQQMNFFSVIFIFICIVLPVAIMILGAVRNSPVGSAAGDLFKSVPLTPEIMALFYAVVMPVIFVMLNLMVYMTQPKM
ncbi:MAG: type II secretion system F family protein [Candidatus Diapherotrites archaeon]|nr:type II secretion system F family protein [Candidatus Diapherotrites archaeon]